MPPSSPEDKFDESTKNVDESHLHLIFGANSGFSPSEEGGDSVDWRYRI